MEFPSDLKYTNEHEYVRVDGDVAVVGITDHAQSELGDVVFVELPEVGTEVAQNDEAGTIESVKAVSEIYAPVSGTIIECNEGLTDTPELVNESPYGEAWLYKVKISNPDELEGLLSVETYQDLVAQQ